MNRWQDRFDANDLRFLVKERDDLEIKIRSLREWIDGEKFQNEPHYDQILKIEQLEFMQGYYGVLLDRIERLLDGDEE
jgi:hypothetical protein